MSTADKLSGQEIRAMREKLGYTEDELGEILGTDALTISEWESGLSQPALPGAVWLALECLEIRLAFKHPFFDTIDARNAQLNSMRQQAILNRQEFEKPLIG